MLGRLLDHFIFPLLQRHAIGEKSPGAVRRFRGTHIQVDVGGLEHAAFRQRVRPLGKEGAARESRRKNQVC